MRPILRDWGRYPTIDALPWLLSGQFQEKARDYIGSGAAVEHIVEVHIVDRESVGTQRPVKDGVDAVLDTYQ